MRVVIVDEEVVEGMDQLVELGFVVGPPVVQVVVMLEHYDQLDQLDLDWHGYISDVVFLSSSGACE